MRISGCEDVSWEKVEERVNLGTGGDSWCSLDPPPPAAPPSAASFISSNLKSSSSSLSSIASSLLSSSSTASLSSPPPPPPPPPPAPPPPVFESIESNSRWKRDRGRDTCMAMKLIDVYEDDDGGGDDADDISIGCFFFLQWYPP